MNKVEVFISLELWQLQDCPLPRACFSNSDPLGTKSQLWELWDLLRKNVLRCFKAMLAAPVRSSVPFSQQCPRGRGDAVWSVVFVHIPEDSVKITKAIFPCTCNSEISLEKIGSLLVIPTHIPATYCRKMESESLCNLQCAEQEENWLYCSWGTVSLPS